MHVFALLSDLMRRGLMSTPYQNRRMFTYDSKERLIGACPVGLIYLGIPAHRRLVMKRLPMIWDRSFPVWRELDDELVCMAIHAATNFHPMKTAARHPLHHRTQSLWRILLDLSDVREWEADRILSWLKDNEQDFARSERKVDPRDW